MKDLEKLVEQKCLIYKKFFLFLNFHALYRKFSLLNIYFLNLVAFPFYKESL